LGLIDKKSIEKSYNTCTNNDFRTFVKLDKLLFLWNLINNY